MLSEAARSVWAKSLDEGAWLPLWQHLYDSADIAGALVDHWLAPAVIDLFAREFDGDVDQARTAACFLAGIHDLGKATPAFAIQDTFLAQQMRDHGLWMPASKVELSERVVAPHALAGQQILVDSLCEEHGWTGRVARTWGVVVGGHHGVPPTGTDEQYGPRTNPDLYGEGRWKQVQHELVDHLAARTGADAFLDRWRARGLSAQFQVLATALVITADWIASNKALLPFHRDALPEVGENVERIQRAVAELALPRPWRPADPPQDIARLFATRFQLPVDAQPRPVQQLACEVAREMPDPGLLIVEAPMGEGKTEAALAAAEILAARGGAGGLLVALPTQATSDAMFARVLAWLDALGSGDQQIDGSIMLSHGKSRFNREFQGLVRAGRLAEIGVDDERVRRAAKHPVLAHAWLTGRKKSALANFVVGTIDQLLFAGLKSRHLMLRHLGLAGKVVVLDEIHAYDAYMNSYLTRVLTWLGAYRVPVVALSATLPGDRRRALVEAYERGRDLDGDQESRAGSVDLGGNVGYPVLTWTQPGRITTWVAENSARRTSVAVNVLAGGLEDDDLDSVIALLRDQLSEGGTALVVRNTVRRVLAAARALEREFPSEVTVTHARFIVADRLRNDHALLDSFGPPGRAVARPHRHVVVASQVVEQSLDVDFDLLITDLAPIDLVLQRMGRLHRHQRGEGQAHRPRKLRTAGAFLTGVDLSGDVPKLEPSAERYVYGRYPLLRAAATLLPRLGASVELPTDISTLVQQAYGADRIGPPGWQDDMDEARVRWEQRTAAREAKAETYQIAEPSRSRRAISGWVSGNVGDVDDETPEGQGQVRDGTPSLEAILVCEDDAGRWRTPAWLDDDRGGLDVPRDEVPSDDRVQVMAECSLRLPLTFSNEKSEDELWSARPEPWEGSPLIYRLPVLRVTQDGWGEINGSRVRYTPQMGLEVFA
jgi:CRISPR-associated helicase Cas3/CRISPR-associated endonuclease Cas3-HD